MLAPSQTKSKQIHSIEGLRGFLALSVFICHGSEYFYILKNEKITPDTFYELIGDASVSLFFMITGFLFWSKIIASKGHLDIRQFAVSRLARLMPMYTVTVGLVLLVQSAKNGIRHR